MREHGHNGCGWSCCFLLVLVITIVMLMVVVAMLKMPLMNLLMMMIAKMAMMIPLWPFPCAPPHEPLPMWPSKENDGSDETGAAAAAGRSCRSGCLPKAPPSGCVVAQVTKAGWDYPLPLKRTENEKQSKNK